MKMRHITYLSLGTNQGNKLKNLQNAIDFIGDKVGDIQEISSVYKTASWGFSGDFFYNICIKVFTYQDSETLLNNILGIEKELGRQRTNQKVYQNRNIDIDILLFNDEVIFLKTLIIPHSKMLNRKFVMVPLTEIACNLVHPIEKKK